MSQLKAGLHAAGNAGDFGVIAQTIEQLAIDFADGLGDPRGLRVLDVATGSGNVALPLARRGAVVTGCDIARHTLEQARVRATAEQLDIRFDEADAEALPYADGSFDWVVSMFGAMFAPRPAVVAAEMARVLRPGGLLALANWNPESFSAALFRMGSKYSPRPTGLPPPVLWGDAQTVDARLAADFEDIQSELVPLNFDLPMSPAGVVQMFRTHFGPTVVAFQGLDDVQQAAFQRDLEALWGGANTATDPEHHTLIPNSYLRVTALRR